MAIKQYAVKITTSSQINETFLECLRYAGLISEPKFNDDNIHTSFRIQCPKSIGNPKAWAEMNAERMKTFGYQTEVVELKQ